MRLRIPDRPAERRATCRAIRRIACRTIPAAALAVPAALPRAAWAGRRVIVADGTAGPDAQAAAAMMVLFPVVAVLVFALARLIAPPRG